MLKGPCREPHASEMPGVAKGHHKGRGLRFPSSQRGTPYGRRYEGQQSTRCHVLGSTYARRMVATISMTDIFTMVEDMITMMTTLLLLSFLLFLFRLFFLSFMVIFIISLETLNPQL